MPLADSKKVQSMVNIAAEQGEIIRAAIQKLKDTKAVFVAVNPDVTGTPLEGQVGNLNNVINDLDTLINVTDKAIWDGLIAAKVPSHEGKALE